MAGLAVLAAFGLLLPWARTGDRNRSSIDLLSSAGALDVVTGWPFAALLIGWFSVVVAAALALVLVAWGRTMVGVSVAGLVGPGVIVALVAVSVSPLALAWGAWIASGLGVGASIGSGLLVLSRVAEREGLVQ